MVRWLDVCMPNLKGGLCVRDLHLVNLAFAWKVAMEAAS
jgi:hypothetical protein